MDAQIFEFFGAAPWALALYEPVEQALYALSPTVERKVQKTQITFYDGCVFACVSLPRWRSKDWPERCLVISFGLAHRLNSPRVAVAVEPYPGRWTHHVLLTRQEGLDGELLDWLREAWSFSKQKRRKGKAKS